MSRTLHPSARILTATDDIRRIDPVTGEPEIRSGYLDLPLTVVEYPVGLARARMAEAWRRQNSRGTA